MNYLYQVGILVGILLTFVIINECVKKIIINTLELKGNELKKIKKKSKKIYSIAFIIIIILFVLSLWVFPPFDNQNNIEIKAKIPVDFVEPKYDFLDK